MPLETHKQFRHTHTHTCLGNYMCLHVLQAKTEHRTRRNLKLFYFTLCSAMSHKGAGFPWQTSLYISRWWWVWSMLNQLFFNNLRFKCAALAFKMIALAFQHILPQHFDKYSCILHLLQSVELYFWYDVVKVECGGQTGPLSTADFASTDDAIGNICHRGTTFSAKEKWNACGKSLLLMFVHFEGK